MEMTNKTWNQRFKDVKHRFNKKARECLSLDEDTQEVLKDFEASLMNSYITSSSFKEITHSNLNQTGRRKQLMVIIFLALYAIPVYGIQSVLFYFKDVKWTLFQTVFPDFCGHIPLVIPMLTHLNFSFMMNVVPEKVLFWKFEVKNSLEFLTDMQSLIEARRYFGLNDEEINRLLKTIKTKTIVFKMTMVSTVVTALLVQSSGMIFMFYKNPPPAAYALYALSYLIFPSMVTTILIIHFFNLYLAYIIMTDCLNARIKSVMNQLETHRIDKKDYCNLLAILSEVESIFKTLKDYNKVVKFLLRNMIYFFRTGLLAIFVLISLNMEVYLRALMTFPLLSVVCVIIMTGLYVSGTKNMLFLLYKELNTCYVRSVLGSEYSLKLKFKARLLIKELGNDDNDGHFVLGFADGNGPEISKMEITNLILDTIGNSMMILRIIRK